MKSKNSVRPRAPRPVPLNQLQGPAAVYLRRRLAPVVANVLSGRLKLKPGARKTFDTRVLADWGRLDSTFRAKYR